MLAICLPFHYHFEIKQSYSEIKAHKYHSLERAYKEQWEVMHQFFCLK